MGSSQIKGHRIAERQVENKHLHDSFKLHEDKLELNHPTHNNDADLTVAQKNTLTQMGNADSLHFHTGGGGGPQGIYTNEERDVQLLKLSMLIGSTKYGMDKSVKDELDDDSAIDFGVRPASAPDISNLTYAPGSPLGTLKSNQIYSYGVAYKSKHGITNVPNGSSITTTSEANNSVQVVLKNVPPENEGAVLYRCEGAVEKLIIENEEVSEWENPNNLEINVEGSDKTSGYGSVKVNLKGFNSNGSIIYPKNNIAYGVGKRTIPEGEQLSAVQTKQTPFVYYVGINNKGNTNRIDLVWDRAPSNVPMDYELYYSTDTFVNDVNAVTWCKFEKLVKPKSNYGATLNINTDGQIGDNHNVTGNTRPQNVFLYKTVPNISAIKVVVTRVQQSCMLRDIRLFTENNSVVNSIYKDFGTPQNFSQYGTIKVDVKSNMTHSNIKMLLTKGTDTITGATTDWSISCNGSPSSLTGNTLRVRVMENNTWDKNAYDRVRFCVRGVAGQYLKFENIFLTLANNGHSHIGVPEVDTIYPEVMIPVTFGGQNFYEGKVPNDTLIWSDWMPIKFYGRNFSGLVVTMSVVSGSLMYASNEYTNAWTCPLAHGLEGDKWLTSIGNNNVSYYVNWNFMEQVQFGQSNAKNIALDDFSQNALDGWHRHYLPIPSGASADDIKKLMFSFDNLLVDQDIYFDNITLSKSKDVLNQIAGSTIISSNGGINHNEVKVNSSSYYESDLAPTNANPKSIGFTVPTPIDVNKILIYFGSKANAANSYAIQYSNDATADINDAYDSSKWLPVENIVIGESGMPSEFTGNIVGNVIFDNKVWSSHLAHTFKNISVLKLRVVIFSTIGGATARISNIKLMTAENLGDLVQIYETNNKVNEGQVIIDDGKVESTVKPSQYNTTGSYNVTYDSNLRLMKLIDKSKKGSVLFDRVPLDLYQHLLLTAQVTGNVKFYVSNDNSTTFAEITPDKVHTFSNQSQMLTIKADLLSNDAMISAIAFLYNL